MTTPAAKKKAFVLSPIGEDKSETRVTADKVLKHLIRKALGAEFDVDRADAETNPGEITPTMIASILDADLIVADLSGLNPNVFYELAIAHGFRKPTVHIQRADEKLPFDVQNLRTVRYDISDPEELEKNQKKLKDYAASALKDPDKVLTPLSSAQRFVNLQKSTDPVAESNVQVFQALTALRDEVRAQRGGSGIAAARQRLASAQAKLAEEKANGASVAMILSRAAEASRLRPEDFRHAITRETGVGFDNWLRSQLALVMPGDDAGALDAILLHPDAVEDDDDVEFSDEPPF